MSIVHIIFEDKDDNTVNVKFISNQPVSENIEEWTTAELMAKQISDIVTTIMQEGQINAE